MKIRRQFNELTTQDLTRYPVWQYALDEEDIDGQDETTLKPYTGAWPPAADCGPLIVSAAFWFADGSEHIGCVTLPPEGERTIDAVQPVILTLHGPVFLWSGVLVPSSDSLALWYALLGRPAESVFPCRFESTVSGRDQIAGVALGFMHYQSFSDQTIVVVR